MNVKLWMPRLLLAALPFYNLTALQADTPNAIGVPGNVVSLKSVEVENTNVYDYTFATAPADWRVQSGIWEMTNRWDCSPGWSWFGGRSDEVAAIWNKRKFSGDFSVQFYFGFKMDFVKTPTWHYHPQNVALSFCGDGKNLGSGYSLVIGADNNQRTLLLKQGKVMAETRAPEALLYTMNDGYPPAELLHRRWWHVKVNKVGNRIECWLDGKLIFKQNDAQPLEAGQFALWAFNNGIMLSRVQIFYENEVKPIYAKRSLVTPKSPKAATKIAQR